MSSINYYFSIDNIILEMAMSSSFTKIEGSYIRRRLRELGLPGGGERVCCGGRISFSKDYRTQLKTLKMRGKFKVCENGIVMDTVTID